MKKILSLCFILLSLTINSAQCQQFLKDIQAFEKADATQQPPENAILFIGSSSFTMWQNVHDYFPEHQIINRGFGGSSLYHLIDYANQVIFPYNPKQIVIYCGENDIVASNEAMARTVYYRFIQLYGLIRSKLPDVNITYVSMKPSPHRKKFLNVMRSGNKYIQEFIATQQNTFYVDVYSKMFDDKGEIMSDIFIHDQLHMNAKGYEIWQKELKPYLVVD